MKYYVTFAVDARYTAEVEANSFEEAKKLAEEEFCDADWNEMEYVDHEPVNAEREDGEFIDY